MVAGVVCGYVLSSTGDGVALESDFGAAETVICQAACINHGAYWRAKNYCKRTGTQCKLVKKSGHRLDSPQPQAHDG
jgi:hypothetical protein